MWTVYIQSTKTRIEIK